MTTNELLDKINDAMFDNIDLDALLDKRDTEPFDSEWVRVYEKVEEQKEQGFSDEAQKRLDDCREQAYRKAYDLCGDSEVAACVSDDFGLMFDSEVLGCSDAFLEYVMHSYSQSKIPCDNG